MPKRKNPDTSIAAYHAATEEMIAGHYAKIITALRMFPRGLMYEQIAGNCKLTKEQIGRRLCGLERMKDAAGNPNPLIFKTEEKRKTASGRDAYVYKLTAAGEAYIIPDKYLPGKTIVEYSKAIQSIQPTLF